MNLQPYKVIVVRDPPVKQSLSLCMSKNNAPKVLNSGASLIVCCDMGLCVRSDSEVDSSKCVEDFGRFAYPENWREKTKRMMVYCASCGRCSCASESEVLPQHVVQRALRLGAGRG